MVDQNERKAFGFKDWPWHTLDSDLIGGDTAQFARFVLAAGKESDRGLALICTSYLDEMLRRTIAAFLVDEEIAKTLLNGAVAPLGSFSARIKTAYALGLIDKPTMDDFDRLRSVRNTFAHHFDTSFEVPKVRDLCGQLSAPGQEGRLLSGTTREKFSFAAIAYAMILGFRLSHLPMYQLRTIEWARADMEQPDEP